MASHGPCGHRRATFVAPRRSAVSRAGHLLGIDRSARPLASTMTVLTSDARLRDNANCFAGGSAR